MYYIYFQSNKDKNQNHDNSDNDKIFDDNQDQIDILSNELSDEILFKLYYLYNQK